VIRSLVDGLRTVYSQEGFRGLYKGSLLALVGVTNGSIQFAAYEEIKRRRSDLKRARIEGAGGTWRTENEMLVRMTPANPARLARGWCRRPTVFGHQTNTEYILASGLSKGLAIAVTYPYQVVRAKIQVRAPHSVRHTLR
jgi:solute carrier family 25 folate transporter 32